MAERVRLGDMLLRAKLVTEAQVEQALESQKESGRRLGEEMVALGFLNELQVTQVLSNQLSVPWVDLRHVEFSRELLGLIPAELAHTHCLIPIYVRHLRKEGAALFVAMDDPTDQRVLEELSNGAGIPVKAMVAPPTDIRDAIGVYYFGTSPDVQTAADKKRLEEAAERARDTETEERPGIAKAAEPPGVAVAEPSAVDSLHPKPRLVTLTLLDGTTVRLPQKRREGDAEKAQAMTATDIVRALRAKAHGQDVSEVLPDDSLELIAATLLALLVQKGLIADWEFVDELDKQRKRKK